jgi:hypothetical protein
VDVFIAPLEVVDDAFVSQLLFDNKQVLEKLNYAFVDVKVVKLCDHGLLVF